ncbi:Chromosome segregation ATPase-like protein [Halogeometricum pallidum JCM 14848]|uniref:Chromosome segregation ATPase-like protein n=1 Tax=Halogeometricum pallidum JCM 14848 TaxID=1227487 RepID=M0DA21_HALPD|nr:BGTF surface domain-containing protein [Halogeometricum pallidum]ELZ31663.1 Chromosome segregation ATPase-like protein [Halogeometricum pallidum JCM 14848]
MSGLDTDSLTLRKVTGSGTDEDTSFVRQLSADGNTVDIDTENLEGRYRVTDGSNNVDFEVAVQTLQANWSEDTVNQGSNDQPELELESNRNGYLVNVSADNLDADELEMIFEDSAAYVSTDEDEDLVTLNTSSSEGEDIQANFTDDIDAGDYEFDVEVTDTTASDSASIEVTETDADVNFAQSVYSEQVGDVVEMSVEMEDRDEAYVFIGGDDVNYLEAVKVIDDNEDGVVNFTFNTYTANTDEMAFEAVGDDEVEAADIDTESGDALPENLDGNLSSRLETGDYDLRSSTSNDYNAADDEVVDEQDVATLDLGERNTSGIATWTAASGNAGEFEDTEELLQNVNQSNTVAIGDRLVVQVNASGTSGIIDEDNLDTLLSGDEGISFTIEEADAGANADAASLTLDGSNTAVYQNETSNNDQFFVVVDTRNVDVEDDTEYEATFTVGDEDNSTSPIDYVDDEEEESVSTTFTAAEPDATLDLNDDDQFEVAQSQNAQVEFDTNLAGGSEVSVRLRSSASNNAFLLSNTVETDGNGTVSTTFDTSDIEVGTEFDMIVRASGDELASEDGIIVEGSNMTGTGEGTMSETPGTGTEGEMTTEMPTGTSSEESPTEGSATPSEGTGTGSTDGGTPGFGVVVAVTALLAAALLAVRRD